MPIWILTACLGQQKPRESAPFERMAPACEAGVVTQVLDAGSYRYLAYETPAGEARWIATLALGAEPALGSAHDFVRYGQEQGFHSARLDRSFNLLFFGFSGDCETLEG
ncbi:MAG: hypothetical protein VX899_01650 [Myxococcota bacterium]|nr:hypothetical protein [Myxococcota bacterium]